MGKGIVTILGGLCLLAVLAAGTFLINSTCFVAGKAVEREALEHSHQYQSARQSEVAKYTAELASLNSRLSDPTLTAAERANLTGQINAINIRLSSARRRMK